MHKVWHDKAWNDYVEWQNQDKTKLLRSYSVERTTVITELPFTTFIFSFIETA